MKQYCSVHKKIQEKPSHSPAIENHGSCKTKFP